MSSESLMSEKKELMKRQMKAFLYDLAEQSANPAAELEALIADAISELYWEAKAALESRKAHLKLVPDAL